MRRWLLTAILGLALLLGPAFLFREEIAHYLPVPESQKALARHGVANNAAWRPTLHRFDGVEMALVPAGCFMMGSTTIQLETALDSCDRYYGAWGCQREFSEEQPAHEVCFEEPFWMDVTEVTNRAYGSSSSVDMTRRARWPRETVTWDQASAHCKERGARLPSEAEWEYASRGPDALIFPWGNEIDTNLVVWFTLNPYDVGGKREGISWVGVHDLSGSIAEWVADWYGPYSAASPANPKGPEHGDFRVVRGGDWFSRAAFFLRAAHRERYDPGFASSILGFRCVKDFE